MMKSVTNIINPAKDLVIDSLSHAIPARIPIDPRLFQLRPTRLPPLPRTRDLLHIYGIRAKKNLSQNFLLRQKLLRRMVRAAGVEPGFRVIEVGCGPGNLSRAILERSPFELLAIEKDRRFLPLLEQLADSVQPGQFKILLADALDHNFDNLFGDPIQVLQKYDIPEDLPNQIFNFHRQWQEGRPPIRIVGNLPFSISTVLLIKWLNHISQKNSFWQYGRVPMLLTFQDEVARRICAEPTASERSRLSAMSQNYCHVEYLFKINGSMFTPEAAVDTGVVRLVPRREPCCETPFKLYEKFVRTLFHHRNHNLAFNYSCLFPRDMRERALACLELAHVNPRIYPYMIGNGELSRLCDEYYAECKKLPSLAEFDYRASKKLMNDASLRVLQEAGLSLLE